MGEIERGADVQRDKDRKYKNSKTFEYLHIMK